MIRPLTQNLLRGSRKRRLLDERSGHEKQLQNPYVQDKGPAIQSIKNIDEIIKKQAPYPLSELTGDEKDRLHKMEVSLAEKIRDGLPTVEEQRRCPAGNVDRHMRAEKVLKKDILTWKNIRIQLNPDCEDQDLANIETLRKEKGTSYSGMMANAEGPRGHLGFQDVPQENWDMALGEPTADTALKQAERVHEETKKRGRPPMTEERKQKLRDSLQAAREAKAKRREEAAAL